MRKERDVSLSEGHVKERGQDRGMKLVNKNLKTVSGKSFKPKQSNFKNYTFIRKKINSVIYRCHASTVLRIARKS